MEILILARPRRVPLWGGVLITIADTFVFLFLDKYGNVSSPPRAGPAAGLPRPR